MQPLRCACNFIPIEIRQNLASVAVGNNIAIRKEMSAPLSLSLFVSLQDPLSL
jgi:hypothetical protein